MFRGNCPTRLDDKGRLKIPADFKREIERKKEIKEYDDQFYITSRDGKVIELYPLKEWEAYEAKLKNLPPSNQTIQKLVNTTSLYGQELTLDNQGRLTIAERLRKKFRLEGEVAVIGKLTWIEIRPNDEFEATVESNLPTPEDMDELARLGL
jgi:MraZ protein